MTVVKEGEGKETTYDAGSPIAVATATVPTTATVPKGDEPKEGHSCCGCCCDTRRAVIIVNIVNMVFSSIYLILFVTGVSIIGTSNATDDVVQTAQSNLDSTVIAVHAGFLAVSIACYSFGIYGAIQYKIWPVIITMVWHGIEIVFSIIYLNPIGIAIAALFLYPHAVLVHELKKGIMSKETYPREEQSCCCV